MEQLQSSQSVESLQEPATIHSQAPLGAPPSLDGLTEISSVFTNGKVSSTAYRLSKRSPTFQFQTKPAVASQPAITTGVITTRQQPQSKVIPQPQSKAIEYSRWRDRLLNPRVAPEREICIELERELSSDEKQRWDTFRQYLRSLAGDNAENKAEAQAFQPFRNRTRLSWRVVEIAEHGGTVSKNGKEAQTKRGSPYICIEGVRTKENAQNLHAFLSKRKARAEYHPPFKLCYSLAHIEAPFFPKPNLSTQQKTPLETLCGQLVVENTEGSSGGYSAFTIGGLVQIGNEVFALSSRHDSLSEETTETDESSSISIEALQDSSDFDEDIEPALILEPEPPEYESDTVGRSVLGLELSPVPSEGSAKQLTDLVGNMVYGGDEWCLYRVDDPSLRLPNSIPRTGEVNLRSLDPHGSTYITTLATEPASGAVVVVGGRSGLVHARMSPNSSDIFLPSGKVLEVWRITFERGGIRRGDSGSWVVDLESGVVFGHIIAMTNNAAYVLPIGHIFRVIDYRVGNMLGCRLVSAFDCLADLAKFYARSSPTLAEAFARKAISFQVLNHSEPSPSANLLQTYSRERQRSPEEEGILVGILLKYGSNLHALLSSGSALAKAREFGNYDKIFREVVSELVVERYPLSHEHTSVEQFKPQRISSPAQSVRPAAILEDLRPSREYDVADVFADITTSTDPWVIFSRNRIARRTRLLETLTGADRDVIEREQLRIDYLRKHFGTDRLHGKDQGYLVDEMGSAHRLWKIIAASRADAAFRQGKYRTLSDRDRMTAHQVRGWRGRSEEPMVVHAHGPYRDAPASVLTPDIEEDHLHLESGWGYAGVIALDQGSGGVTGFKSQRLALEDILSMASAPISPTSATKHGQSVEMSDKIRYFHLPANHTRWVEDFMSAYYKASVDGDSYYDRSSMQRHSRPTKAFIWGIREHKGRLAPVHARQIMPHSSTGVYTPFVSKEITFRSTALFIPYLDSEECSSVQRAGHVVRAADLAQTGLSRVPMAEQGTSRAADHRFSAAMSLADFIGRRFGGRSLYRGPARGAPTSESWLPIQPLARYLLCAAKLYRLFEEVEAVDIIKKDVRGPSPLHLRRTLEQFRNWPSADNTDQQDSGQTVRQESLRQRIYRRRIYGGRDDLPVLTSPLVMVDQLWLWILDDKTVLSSFPRSWGDRNGQKPTDVYSHITHRLESIRPEEMDSAYDVALIIVEECSKALFRQDRGMSMIDLYGSAVSRLATSTSAAYDTFRSDAEAACTEDTLSSMARLLRIAQGLCKRWRTFDELERANTELKTVGKVLSEQIDVLKGFERTLQELEHSKAKDRASRIVEEITTRRSEVEDLTSILATTICEFEKLQALQQQQVTVAHARIALQGVYEQGLHHANGSASASSSTPQYRINSKGRVVSARGKGFVEKNEGNESGITAMVNRDKTKRPSVWARMGEAVGLKKRDAAGEKRLGAGTTTTSKMV